MSRRSSQVVLVLAMAFVAAGTPSWGDEQHLKVDAVIALLKGRETAVRTLDVTVEKDVQAGPDWKDYSLDREKYDAALARFYGYKYKPRPPLHESHTNPRPKSFYRYQRNEAMHARLDWLNSADPNALVSTMTFDGSLWQTVSEDPERGPKVTLDSSASIAGSTFPPILELLGLGGRIGALDYSQREAAPGAETFLSTFLEEAVKANEVADVHEVVDAASGKVVEIVIRRLVAPAPGSGAWPGGQVTLALGLAHGLAPVRLSTACVAKENGRFVEVPGSPTVEARWMDLEERDSGVWLPGRLQVDLCQMFELPEGDDFVPQMKAGVRVLDKGRPRIDPDKTKRRRYHGTRENYTFLDVRVNALISAGLAQTEFPPGTIVHDRRKEEVFQLTGTSPVVDAALKRSIDPLYEGENVKKRWLWPIVGLNIVVLALVVMWWWRRRRHRALYG